MDINRYLITAQAFLPWIFAQVHTAHFSCWCKAIYLWIIHDNTLNGFWIGKVQVKKTPSIEPFNHFVLDSLSETKKKSVEICFYEWM